MRPDQMVKLAECLDEVANWAEPRDQRLAYRIDRLSDTLERMAKQARRTAARHRSDVLQRDIDEPYMDRFNETGAYKYDADEPYMGRFSNADEFPGVRERMETGPVGAVGDVRQQPSQRHFTARRRMARRPRR